jgi:ribulose-5-phosphate 4-epimerase/fuculose-1-phosphate aldolase
MPDASTLLGAVDDLVVANHILFSEGIVDAFGHVSMRHPTRPDRYLMARTLQPVFVSRADIVEHDMDSNPIPSDAPVTPWERFIHGEIYRVRPDVGAVVHSHAPAVLPFSVAADTPLRAICHTAGFLGDGAPTSKSVTSPETAATSWFRTIAWARRWQRRSARAGPC